MQTKQFAIEGAPVSVAPYGSGHINQTSLVVTNAGKRYILQKINHTIFHDVPGLMSNIARVTRHLQTKDPDPRHVLRLVPTLSGDDFLTDDGYYRMYEFVEGSLCLDQPERPEDFYQSAVAFGTFQRQLADFPADTLHATIPRFHDTPDRYRLLREAVRRDEAGRLREVGPEVDFALKRAEEADALTGRALPLRVTHNDTKLNNVLLDARTRQPLCVIDLDTVMPGLAAHDFGDSIRFGASTAPEDERDLSKVTLSVERYALYLKGFLGACGAHLTALERETLPLGAKLMTLECGVRFLTDYLSGDVYFKTHRPGHNLDRCRTQFKLVSDMEKKWASLAVDNYPGNR